MCGDCSGTNYQLLYTLFSGKFKLTKEEISLKAQFQEEWDALSDDEKNRGF